MDVYSRRSTAAAQLALHILIFMRTLQSVWIFAARPQPALELPCAVFGRADAIARNEVAIQRHIMPAACKLPPRWRCVTHPRHGCTLARLAGRTTALFQDVPTCCTLLHRASGRVRCFAECWLLAIMCQPAWVCAVWLFVSIFELPWRTQTRLQSTGATRLHDCCAFYLYRRFSGDMTKVFKMVHKYYDVSAAVKLNFITFSTKEININCQKCKPLKFEKTFFLFAGC